jgi:hypothetical protein
MHTFHFGGKMKLKQLFDVFSRRQSEKSSNQRKPLTDEFRNRIFMICRDRFSEDHIEFWTEIHNKFQYLLGRPRLSDSFESNQIEDLLQFLSQCRDNNFLDFIEYIFRFKYYWRGFPDVNELVDIINDLFLIDDLPYAITKYVQKERIEKRFVGNIEVQPNRFIDTISYPKIVCREDQVTHSFTIEPTLQLLSDKRFETANQEFLDALEDYRKEIMVIV